MKTILAAIDFSQVSDLVVAEAAALARPLGGKVVLVTVLVEPVFVKEYAPIDPGPGPATDRAIRGFVERYGPPDAAAAAKARTRLAFLDYDWSLNDIDRPAARD